MSNISIAIPITESSLVGEARRCAVSLAAEVGFDETDRGKIAIIVTELATNISRHAEGAGQILLRILSSVEDGVEGLEILALDTGPGFRDSEKAMNDGYSTAGSAGEGLGAVRRFSSVFDLYTYSDRGAAVLSQFHKSSTVDKAFPVFGVVSVPKPGETVCGDSWAVGHGPGGEKGQARFIVADGLGHGPAAAEASQEAVIIFREQQEVNTSPQRVLESAHKSLRSTRGAAAAVAFVESQENNAIVRCCGIGNIMSCLSAPEESRIMISHNGTVGDQISRFHELEYTFAPLGGLLVMASDGLTTRWRLDQYPGIWEKHPALVAGVLYRDYCRGRDDATVLVARLHSNLQEYLRRNKTEAFL